MARIEWSKIAAVQARLRPVISAIVERHRTEGKLLTWHLMHDIEDEAMNMLRQTGDLDEVYINMVQSSPLFRLPKTDDPVDFKGSEVMPTAFWMIREAYLTSHELLLQKRPAGSLALSQL